MESLSFVDGVLPEVSRSWRFWPWRPERGGSGSPEDAAGAPGWVHPPGVWLGVPRAASAAVRMREIMTAETERAWK
eukprot:3099535-Heterocapsa_arctica.AAC.1